MTYRPHDPNDYNYDQGHAQPYDDLENRQPGHYQYKYLKPPPRRRQSGAWRWVRRIFLVGVVGLLLACIGLVVLQQRVAGNVALADVREDRPGTRLLTQPSNILLLGVDLRPDAPQEGVRSDTILLLHLDPIGGWASLLSIPRDSVAAIPGFGEAKINAAFSHGYNNAEQLYGPGTDPTAAGAALAADTVEQFLGLSEYGTRIHYVATINFDGFAKIIDALGGVTVDVPREIVDTEYPTEDFGTTTIRFEPGVQQLDGERALQYVRTRHADSDFGRGERQQQVVRAMLDALRQQPLLLRPGTTLRLMDATGDAVRTTMPVGRPDALLLGPLAGRIDPDRIATYRISPETVRVRESGSDLFWNREDVLALTQRALQPPDPAAAPSASPEPATIQVQNGAGVAGIAGQVSDQLQQAGLTVAAPDNADLAEQTQVIDYGDHPVLRQRLATILGDVPVIERPASEAPPGVDLVLLLGSDYATYIDR